MVGPNTLTVPLNVRPCGEENSAYHLFMNNLETTVEELRSLRPDQLEAAARYIHRLKIAGHRMDGLSLSLAIGLFVSEDATLGQAAEVAGLAQADFLHELGKRRIPIHYGMEELAEDLRVVEALAPR